MRRIWTPEAEVDELSTMADRVRRLREDLKNLKDTVEANRPPSGDGAAGPRSIAAPDDDDIRERDTQER
jgi:hypothetical protein